MTIRSRDLSVFDRSGGDFAEAATHAGRLTQQMVLEGEEPAPWTDDGVLGFWTKASRPSIRIQGADGSIEWDGPPSSLGRGMRS